ncbi:peptide MFS transporter [Hufsiella ginkgonis]|uniref:MFS transporter n=1 Tax=Hufsiella ginkgonis TaxID=2695274 RepID=A0A7K1XZU2_9SPHI|nr:oligopeptide:H+ symporter [Hufsiella ginkgonis]MXV16337.1 MFS transporter [Hufsiella ginkgonis]
MDVAKWTLILGWAFVALWIPVVIITNRKTHPKALFLLFFTEMWERFSYYGMRALLTLYMVNVLFLGDKMADTRALGIYGSYTAMAYLFPVLGGMIADKFFGYKKSVVIGGVLMMLGHFCLAIKGSESLFFLSLSLIIAGNGYFKPNLASYLGTFYEKNDPRKDGAFTIYYMGVNIGAFLSTLTCGYVGQRIDWHYGFGLAGIGMAIGVLIFILSFKVFGDTGNPPAPEKKILGINPNFFIAGATLLMIPFSMFLLSMSSVMSTVLVATAALIIGYLLYEAFTSEDKVQGQRLAVIVVLFFFHAVFWMLFEQVGGSLTLFTERNVDRVVNGSEIPASLFQSFNPFYIMVFAPVFSWIWLKLNKAKSEPSTPMKFVLGLFQVGLGFLMIVIGGKFFASPGGLIPIAFVALLYLFNTTGELSLSPVGLSMITKLSPGKIVAFVMGAWYLSIALGNKMAGVIGALTSEGGTASLTTQQMLTQSVSTYLVWGVGVVWAAALILLLFVPKLNKWMNGIH